MTLQRASEEKTKQLGYNILDPIRIIAQFAIHPQAQRIGKATAKHASPRDRLELLCGVVQPGGIDFNIKHMAATGVKPVGMSLGSRVPDDRA